jgi:hypothetical protein
MSKLMWLLGILLIAAGVALGVKGYMAPGQLDVLGLRLDSAIQLIIGGIVSLGLGGVIDGFAKTHSPEPTPKVKAITTISDAVAEVANEAVAKPKIPGFGRKSIDVAAATAAVATTVVAETKSAVNSVAPIATNSVADTIAALEQAKSDIKNALGGVESMTSPAEELQPVHVQAPPQIDAIVEDVAPAEDGELFVVEEKIIRGRPSRILSDDTVEAETDEGWMRFENLEHLNEYLDSTEVGEA